MPRSNPRSRSASPAGSQRSRPVNPGGPTSPAGTMSPTSPPSIADDSHLGLDDNFESDDCDTRTPTPNTTSDAGSSRSKDGPTPGSRSRCGFYEVMELPEDSGTYKWCCVIPSCNWKHSYYSSTTYRKKHTAEHLENNQIPNPLTRDRKMELTLRILTKMSIPFRIVEMPEFRELVGFSTSRRTLRNEFLSRVCTVRSDIVKELAASRYVSLTTDIWTHHSKHFICFTAHYILNFTFKSALIHFTRIASQETALIMQAIQHVLEFYSIQNKCIAITCDGASANTSALQSLNITRRTAHDKEIERIFCTCHILHNCVINALKKTERTDTQLKETKKKIQDLCLKVRRSPPLTQKLERACTDVGVSVLRVRLDVSTRWNTFYMQIDRLLKMRAAFEKLFETNVDFTENEKLTPDDWAQLKVLKETLQPINDATVVLSSSTKANYSQVWVLYEIALSHMTAPAHAQTTFAVNLKEQLEKRKDRVKTGAARIATLLDPYWKRYELSNDEYAEAKKLIKSMIEEVKANEPASEPGPDQPSTSGAYNVFRLARRETGPADELEDFLQTPCAKSRDNCMDPLKWWKTWHGTYPMLYKVAERYLTMQASSVACECAFSQAGDLVSIKRNRLSTESIANHMILHYAFKDTSNYASDSEEEFEELNRLEQEERLLDAAVTVNDPDSDSDVE